MQAWLADLDVVIWTLLAILTWKYVGFAIILFLAGLQNVPDELTEAAAIDGASWWQIQRHVTIPLLGPTIRIWVFLSMIGSLQVFDMIWVTSVPAVRSLGASATMATYMVDNGFFARQWGYGNAVAVILFVISFVAALLFQRFVLRRDIEGAITGRVKLSDGRQLPSLPASARRAAGCSWGSAAHLRRSRSRSRRCRSRRSLYVILGGFRTTPQIAADPAGLPDPWVWDNYASGADAARLLATGVQQRGHRPRHHARPSSCSG